MLGVWKPHIHATIIFERGIKGVRLANDFNHGYYIEVLASAGFLKIVADARFSNDVSW